MNKLYCSVRKFFIREEGATMVEYGLMVALIAVVCLAAVTLLGTNLNGIFNQIAASV
jgi:pilus assembly protein Flp/PilA